MREALSPWHIGLAQAAAEEGAREPRQHKLRPKVAGSPQQAGRKLPGSTLGWAATHRGRKGCPGSCLLQPLSTSQEWPCGKGLGQNQAKKGTPRMPTETL